MALLFKLRTDHLMDLTTGIVANRATETPVPLDTPQRSSATARLLVVFTSPGGSLCRFFSFNGSIIQPSALAQAYYTPTGGGR